MITCAHPLLTVPITAGYMNMPQFIATQQPFTTKFGHHENGNDKPTCDFDTKNDFKSDSNDSRIKIFLVINVV